MSTSTRPTVSVIIPCYNAEAYVEEAVASVQSQTHPPVEILCVNDGSTDGTLDVLRRLERTDDRIRVLDGPNGGAAEARYRGVREATGTYLQFLDADDLLMPGKLAHQVALIQQAPQPPDLIVAAFDLIPYNGHAVELTYGRRTANRDSWQGVTLGIGTPEGCGTMCSNLWRTEAVRAVENTEWGLVEDIQLVMEILLNGGRVLVDEASHTIIRLREHSLRTTGGGTRVLDEIEILLTIRAHLIETEQLTPERKATLDRRLVPRLGIFFHENPRRTLELCDEVFPRTPFRVTWEERGLLYAAVWQLAGFRWAEAVRWRQNRLRTALRRG